MHDDGVERPTEPARAGPASEPGDAAHLTAAVASGDPDALARFYGAWFDRMVGMARRASGRDEAFCLDAVQESFVKMIRKMKRIESDEALVVWVRRVVTRTAYDMIREETRRAGREAHGARERSGEASAVDAGAIADTERLSWLERELATLDSQEAEMMLARHRFGWTLRAIGARFGLSVGAVDGRLTRIAAGIRERAQDADKEPRSGDRGHQGGKNPGLETGATRAGVDGD